MKAIILIFSVIVSILGLIVSQFVYPVIASFFDGQPVTVSIIIGIILIMTSSILIGVITKDKFIWNSILLPLFISLLASTIIISVRFGYGSYKNGYLCVEWDLYSNLGIKFIDSGISYEWYKGVDNYSNEIFVNIKYNEDYDYREEHDYEKSKFDFEIRYYSKDGAFLGKRKTTKYYYDNEKTYNSNYLEDAQKLVEPLLGFTLYKEVG